MSDSIQDDWTLHCQVGDKKRPIEVPKDCSVSELIHAVAELLGILPEHVLLQYGLSDNPMWLQNTKILKQNLSHFGIQDGSRITVILNCNGGVWVLGALKQRKSTLENLKGFVTVTTDPNDKDIITLDGCSPEQRGAKMTCGHVIGPESMTSHCHSLISAGKFIVRCPYVDSKTKKCCNREWPFFVVRHVACLNPDELSDFEAFISQNILNRAKGTQQCPGCNAWCVRQDINDQYVICPLCTKSKGRVYKFCWECRNEWQGGSTCGNNDCADADERLKILKTCPEKMIERTLAPSRRGCPRCGVVIEHAQNCKHMVCTFCSCAFCFFCLRKQKNDKWPCVAYSGDCKVAPRQTTLRRLKDFKFEKFYD